MQAGVWGENRKVLGKYIVLQSWNCKLCTYKFVILLSTLVSFLEKLNISWEKLPLFLHAHLNRDKINHADKSKGIWICEWGRSECMNTHIHFKIDADSQRSNFSVSVAVIVKVRTNESIYKAKASWESTTISIIKALIVLLWALERRFGCLWNVVELRVRNWSI